MPSAIPIRRDPADTPDTLKAAYRAERHGPTPPVSLRSGGAGGAGRCRPRRMPWAGICVRSRSGGGYREGVLPRPIPN